MWNQIPGKELAKQFIKRLFTNGIIKTSINTLIPIIISVYSMYYNDKVSWKWYIPLILLIVFIAIYNIISEVLLNIEKKEVKYMDLLRECYQNHCVINKRSATKIYRLNKIIQQHLSSKKSIDKFVFDKVADFDTVAFDICNSIYKMIEDKFGVDTECEVTVYQSKGKNVSMIAFANKNDDAPLSYRRIYKIGTKTKGYLFIRLFNDLNAQIYCCSNAKEVENDFKYIEGSEIREKKICQYIGIPLKTARKEIELLLQIDVSKPNVFGKKKDDIIKLAKDIFYPYVVLLNKAYERDLIFNGYYDIIVESLSKNESVVNE